MKLQNRIALVCALVGVFLLGLVVGVLRTDFFLRAQASRSLLVYTGAAVVEGTVVGDPERRDKNLRTLLRVERVDGKQIEKGREGKLLAILQRDERVSYGDRVILSGEITPPETFETNTGRVFDYPQYLQVRGVSALMYYARVEQVSQERFSIIREMFEMKHAFERALEKVFVEPQGALAEGILLGEKRGMSEELNHAFIVSGLVHVVVLSGYNISIVAEWVMRAFAFLPKTLGLSLGGVAIVLFAALTGGSATAVRACIMALIAILGRYLERPNDALRALLAAVVVMVLWNPLSTLYDPSFILSVLATFGLITISPAVENKLKFLTEKFGLRSIAASTIAVQLYVLPALLYFTGVLSFVSLPANIVALPVVSLAMLLSFVSGLLALIHPLLAFVPGVAADLLLRWMILVAEVATAMPFSSTIVSAFPAWFTVICYIPLTIIALFLFRKTSQN